MSNPQPLNGTQHPATSQTLFPWQNLTEQEQTLCNLLCSFEMVGLTNPQLAPCLGVSGRTVEKYFQGVYRKLGAVNRAQVVYMLRGNHPGPARPWMRSFTLACNK